MGYYTKYDFTVYPVEMTEKIEEGLKELFGYSVSAQEIKWYEHEDHCKQVTQQTSGVLLSLTGKGEDAGDLWRKDFLDGEIVDSWRFSEIPPPDPALIAKAEQQWRQARKERTVQQKQELEAKLKQIQDELAALGNGNE